MSFYSKWSCLLNSSVLMLEAELSASFLVKKFCFFFSSMKLLRSLNLTEKKGNTLVLLLL